MVSDDQSRIFSQSHKLGQREKVNHRLLAFENLNPTEENSQTIINEMKAAREKVNTSLANAEKSGISNVKVLIEQLAGKICVAHMSTRIHDVEKEVHELKRDRLSALNNQVQRPLLEEMEKRLALVEEWIQSHTTTKPESAKQPVEDLGGEVVYVKEVVPTPLSKRRHDRTVFTSRRQFIEALLGNKQIQEVNGLYVPLQFKTSIDTPHRYTSLEYSLGLAEREELFLDLVDVTFNNDQRKYSLRTTFKDAIRNIKNGEFLTKANIVPQSEIIGGRDWRRRYFNKEDLSKQLQSLVPGINYNDLIVFSGTRGDDNEIGKYSLKFASA